MTITAINKVSLNVNWKELKKILNCKLNLKLSNNKKWRNLIKLLAIKIGKNITLILIKNEMTKNTK